MYHLCQEYPSLNKIDIAKMEPILEKKERTEKQGVIHMKRKTSSENGWKYATFILSMGENMTLATYNHSYQDHAFSFCRKEFFVE